ncbi:MAG TPA: hypothetical protein VMH35_02410 [Streptosporangiaceae bacterium]|nr:hypothetical protein [Streptosporangiaceae bacterium]
MSMIPLGELADGTPYFAPPGEVVVRDSRVVCHLCGRALRSVTVHLRGHGWTKQAYCDVFGLERGQSLEGPDTRKLRAAAFTSRLIFDPAVRAGSAAGRQRARAGQLAQDAAAAATGRRHPEQRRRKAQQAHAGRPAPASPSRSAPRLAAVAAQVAQVAQRHGYPDIGSFVLDRVADGDSLAAISRAAGLHKDWLSRHLAGLDPRAAAALPRLRPARPDTRWQPALDRLGFADVPSYLRDRHVRQHRTANAIAAEAGLSHHAVRAALRRHGLGWEAHTASRHGARQRAAQVAASLGFGSMAGYVAERRAAGWTWRAMSAESGQPESWLRRQAARHGGQPGRER